MKKTPLPSNLRSIPKGFVYLGRGGEFKTLPKSRHFRGYNMKASDRFNESDRDGTKVTDWSGVSNDSFYFAPVDSEIAKLNGLGPRKRKSAPKVPKITPLPKSIKTPDGFVYLGRGGEFKRPDNQGFMGDCASVKMRVLLRADGREVFIIGDDIGFYYFAKVGSPVAILNGHSSAPAAPKPPERPPVKRGDIIETCGNVYIAAYLQIGGESGIVLVNLSNGSRWSDEILKFGYSEIAPIPESYLSEKYEVLDRETILTFPHNHDTLLEDEPCSA